MTGFAPLIQSLRDEADLSEKGLDFMDDDDLANETRVQIGLLRDAAEQIEKLATAAEGLLDWAERFHAGDPKLNPEEWYINRDYARIALGRS